MLSKTGTLDGSAYYLVSTDLQQINWGGSCSFQAFRKWDGLLHAVRSQLLKRATHVICRFAKIIASQYLPHDSMKRCPIRPTAQNIEEVCNFAASCDGGILLPYHHNHPRLVYLCMCVWDLRSCVCRICFELIVHVQRKQVIMRYIYLHSKLNQRWYLKAN